MPYKDPAQQKAYQRAWVAGRRAGYFAEKVCSMCGTADNLELDHIDPDTKLSHKIWSWSESRRQEELAKCQVLCHDHHLEKSILQGPEAQHGSDSKYQAGCKCPECKSAHAARRGRDRRGRKSADLAVNRVR